METRGSRRMLRSLARPFAEFTTRRPSSRSIHTGVTWGLPSGMSVPRLPKAGFWNRSRYFSGIVADTMLSSFSRVSEERSRKHGSFFLRGQPHGGNGAKQKRGGPVIRIAPLRFDSRQEAVR